MEILAILGVGSLLELITYLVLVFGGIIFILKNKTNIFDTKYENLLQIVEVMVEAAEQLSLRNEWTGPEKFQYVYALIIKYAKNLSDDEIKAIIESAVYRLSKENWDLVEKVK